MRCAFRKFRSSTRTATLSATGPIPIISRNSMPTKSWNCLESIIDAADGLTEKRCELDEAIGEITGCAEGAARWLKSLRVEGGAQ